MMRGAVAAVLALAVVLAGGLALAGQDDELWAEALRKERVEGDLKGAVEIYRKLASTSKDRATAARALVQQGIGQEKLGQAEARAAYEKVLADYGDQAEAVALARRQLSRLGEGARNGGGLAVRKIGEVPDLYGSPSPDGRYITCVNWEKGNLAVFETGTGKLRDLTDEGVWGETPQFADNSVWSPDSRQIAYCWIIGKGDERKWELRLIGPDGGKPKVITSKRPKEAPWPIAFSADGRSVLAAVSETGAPKDPTQVVWVDASTGATKPLRQFEKRPNGVQLSPDGRYAVYAVRGKSGDPADIRLWDLHSGADEPLIEHPSDDHSPVWSPDGKHVLFSSDRGRAGLWVVGVKEGKADGAARLVIEGRYNISGFARDGTLYCAASRSVQNVYVADLDVEKGTLGEAKLVPTRHEGMVMNPFWSGDGSKLGFIARRDGTSTLVVRDMSSAGERDVALFESPQLFDDPVWTPDGKGILTATGLQERTVHRFEVADGKSEKLASLEAKPWAGLYKALTRDGNLLLARLGEDGKSSELVLRSIKSGEERTIRRSEREIYRMALSPDGARLAYFEADQQWQRMALMITNIADDSTRIVWEHGGKLFFPRSTRPAWMPDGKRLIVLTYDPNQDSQQLYLVDAETGQHKPIGPQIRKVNRWHPSLSPDGKRLAFAQKHGVLEVWAMNNLLAGGRAEPRP